MKLSEDLRECAKTWSEDTWLNAWADQAEELEKKIDKLEKELEYYQQDEE